MAESAEGRRFPDRRKAPPHRRRMERMMKPARRRARTLPPAAMPAMAGVGSGFGAVEDEEVGWLVSDAVGEGIMLAVSVRVTVVGGLEVTVIVEVMVVVVSALRTLWDVSIGSRHLPQLL